MPVAPDIQVIALEAADLPAAVALSPRLAIGVAPWRPREQVLRAVRQWIDDPGVTADDSAIVFVAKLDGRVVGVVTAQERRHWSGDLDAYVGALATAEDMEGRGVGRLLMEAAERWARDRGLDHLTLETGARNARARGFYRHLGYEEEDIRLTKAVR